MALLSSGMTAFVVTFGRAGEDDKNFKLGDVDSTLQGFSGADYDLNVGVPYTPFPIEECFIPCFNLMRCHNLHMHTCVHGLVSNPAPALYMYMQACTTGSESIVLACRTL